MFFKLLRKKVVFVFLFCLFVLAVFYFLSFRPPRDVYLTDQTSSSTNLIFTTDRPERISVYFSDSFFLLNLLPVFSFSIPSVSEKSASYVHRINIAGLKPNLKYFLAISYGPHNYHVHQLSTYDNAGKRIFKPVILELPEILLSGNQPKKFFRLKGSVQNKAQNPVNNALVLVKNNAESFSTISNPNGMFELDVPQIQNGAILQVTNGISRQLKTITNNSIKKPIVISF